MVPSCFSCNSGKRERTLEEFRNLMRDRKRGLKFSTEQIEYLRQYGFQLPYIEHQFAFEILGWKL